MASKWYVYEALDGEYHLTDASWAEVSAIPRKSVKGFKSQREALDFMTLGGFQGNVIAKETPRNSTEEKASSFSESKVRTKSIDKTIEAEWNYYQSEYDALIYVDGSYRNADLEKESAYAGKEGSLEGSYAYGMVVVDKTGVKKFSKAFGPDETYSPHRNVAGEIKGAEAAFTYAEECGYGKILIRYDYKGIECWASGDPDHYQKVWKANHEATLEYQKVFREMSEKIDIHFAHVDGHTGNEGNEECDRLAKKALFIS